MKGTEERIICFHNPEEQNGYLSNWYMSNFILLGVKYTSMEQYMMHGKAELFNDAETAEQIMNTDDVTVIKQLGRQVHGFVEETWAEKREEIVTAGLLAKFQQDKELLRMLLSTEGSILAECAVRDRIWGIGLSMKDPGRFDQSRWRGQNLLGKCLMAVRKELKLQMKEGT